MTTETTETTALEVVKPELLQVSRAPEVVLEEAHRAAVALKRVIDAKPRKVVLNGETYLEFEDWLTVGKFYGVGVKVEWSRPVEFGEARGFEARAVAIVTATGQEISAADSMCLSDENNWRGKPLFMLRSMASTRACAKALRNVLAWVVVLAGFKPTPAEEIQDIIPARSSAAPQVVKPQEQQAFSGGPVRLVRYQVIPYTRKSGKDAGKVSEFYAVTFADANDTMLEASTFDTGLAEQAKALLHKQVLLSYRPGRREGKFELLSVTAAESETTDVSEIEP